MIGKFTLAAGVLTLALAAGTHVASATSAPQSALGTIEPGQALVQKAHYRRCRYWRHECADRWGWRTRRYFHCLARHGC